MLGNLYALQHPENFLAYIGIVRVISVMENERTAYQEVLEMARRAGNQKHIQRLYQIGD